MVSFTAVRTTGIYCQPGCVGRPLKKNTVPFQLAAAAEAEGFRACLSCRPYRAAPPAFMTGPDIVCRGVGMILDGFLDNATETDMAARLGVSSRHLRRLFNDHAGVTPNELAKSSRAHFARRLLDDTDLTVTEISFAAGFGSVRQMNRVFREIFQATPTELRGKRRQSDRLVADGGLPLRLPFEGSLNWSATLRFFKARSIPGVEHVRGQRYRRTVMIDDHPGVLEMEPLDENHLLVVAHLPHWEELIHIARRATAVFGLTTPIEPANEHLDGDPVLGPLLDRVSGIRVPGTWDPFEVGIMAIIEQAMSVSEARRVAGRIARRWGASVPGLRPLGLTHIFPEPGRLAETDLTQVGLPGDTRESIAAFSRAVANEEVDLDPSLEMDDLIASLFAIPGFGETAAHQIALRLGFRDAFPIDHPDVRQGLERLGWTPQTLDGHPELWKPWRAFAAAYLMMGTGRDEKPESSVGAVRDKRTDRPLEEVNALAALEQITRRR